MVGIAFWTVRVKVQHIITVDEISVCFRLEDTDIIWVKAHDHIEDTVNGQSYEYTGLIIMM